MASTTVNLALFILIIVAVAYIIYMWYVSSKNHLREHFSNDTSYDARLETMKVFELVLNRKPTPDEIDKYSKYKNEQDILVHVLSDFKSTVTSEQVDVPAQSNTSSTPTPTTPTPTTKPTTTSTPTLSTTDTSTPLGPQTSSSPTTTTSSTTLPKPTSNPPPSTLAQIKQKVESFASGLSGSDSTSPMNTIVDMKKNISIQLDDIQIALDNIKKIVDV